MNPFYQGKHVLVAGAAGFIGSHLVDALLAEGASVIGVDNLITGREQNIAHLRSTQAFEFINADITTDPATYIGDRKVDAIFHFASPASPIGYQDHPVETYLVNSYGTHLLLQWMKNHAPTARFLFASTSETYGDPLEHPQKETYWGNVNPNGVRSMYDESKRLGESICGVHARSFGMDVRIIRIFNTYGPRMDPHDGRSLIEFAVHAMRDEDIVIYGDGNQTRSYCYVSDLVRGALLMLSSDTTSGETVNLGNPEEITMLTLVERIEHLLSKKATIVHREARQDDPLKRQPDISKAISLLGWRPTVALDEGLAQTLEYVQTEIVAA